MPNPTVSDAHIDAALTNISVANMQADEMYVANKLFPMIPVQHKSNKYFVYDRRDWLRNDVQERAPHTESAGGGPRLSTDTYFAKRFAIHQDVDPEDRANADSAVDPDVDATDWVTQQMLINREQVVADTFFTTNLWTGSTSGGDETPSALWDTATGTPIADMKAQAISIAKRNAVHPRDIKIVMPPNVFEAITQNPSVQDQIKYVQQAIVTEQILANLIGIGEVLVAWAVTDKSAEGAASEDTDYMWSTKDTLLVYSQPSPGLKKFTAGYIFSWTGLLGAGAFGNRIVRIPVDVLGLGTVRIEGEMAFDPKVVGATGGAFFTGVIS